MAEIKKNKITNSDKDKEIENLKIEISLLKDSYAQLKRTIAEREKVEKELKESKDLLASIVENIPLMIFLKSAKDLKFIMLNRAGEELLGYDKDKLLGKSDLNFFPPEQAAHFIAKDREALKKVGTLDIPEEVIMTAKKGQRVLHTRKICIKKSNGEAEYLLGISEDITDNKKKGEVLRQSEERFKAIFNLSPEPYFLTNFDGVIIDCNQAVEELVGYKKTEMIGRNLLELNIVSPSDINKATKELEDNIKGLASGPIIYNIKTKDGVPKIVEERSAPFISKTNPTILNTAHDITEQEKNKEKLVNLANAVDSSSDVIFVTNPEGIITFINPEFTNLYGYSKAEVIDKLTPRILKSGLTLDKDYKLFWETLLKKQPFKGEFINKARDGQIAVVSVSATPIIVEQKIIGFLAIQHDITEKKKTEQAIKELNEVRNEFIAIISHQLRTPLTAVNWNLETLLNGDFGKMEEVQHKFLQATHEASVEITSRINDLLTAMDIEEGRVIFEKREVTLDSICAAVVNEMKKKCELKNISCSYTAPTCDLPIIGGDNAKIRLIFYKLMENAIDYTKDNGKIDAVLAQNGNVIRFEIKDNGIGIPESEQHRIFTRFFRGSNAANMRTDAFGLGLFMAKYFVEQHGGKIWFESEEGQGSIFWFEIPIGGGR
jgi:PAS domain S-box-containing protein